MIELMVVIALLSLVVYAVVPSFSSSLTADQSEKAARLLITKIRALRPMAVQEQRRYVLHVDMDRKRIWSSHEDMTEEDMEIEAERAIVLSDDLAVREVSMPAKGYAATGTVDISFYPGGYADHAFLVLDVSGGPPMTLEIQPFLQEVRIHDAVR